MIVPREIAPECAARMEGMHRRRRCWPPRLRISNAVFQEGSIGVNYACCEIGRIPAAAASIARGVWCFGMTAR